MSQQQPLDYHSPAMDRQPVSIGHVILGAFVALAAGPGVTIGGVGIAEMISTDPYAGLGGLFIGGAIGIVLTLAAIALGAMRSRSPSGKRRGFGIGLLIGSGVSLLGAGACFALM